MRLRHVPDQDALVLGGARAHAAPHAVSDPETDTVSHAAADAATDPDADARADTDTDTDTDVPIHDGDTDNRPVRLACPDVQGDGAAQSLANDRTDVLTGTWRGADARPDEPADHAARRDRCTIGVAQCRSDRKSERSPSRGIAHALGGGLLLAGPWRVPISARHRYVERW